MQLCNISTGGLGLRNDGKFIVEVVCRMTKIRLTILTRYGSLVEFGEEGPKYLVMEQAGNFFALNASFEKVCSSLLCNTF